MLDSAYQGSHAIYGCLSTRQSWAQTVRGNTDINKNIRKAIYGSYSAMELNCENQQTYVVTAGKHF